METRDLSPTEFPVRILALDDPPSHLTVAGDIDARGAPTIAFVGARAAGPEAKAFASELAAACAERGAIIVSGGAVGIDTASHQGALNVGGRTWSVLGTGKNAVFPDENAALFEKIARAPGCALFWPFEHDRPPRPQNFLARNRVLISLADIVVVLEASEESGSRNSARHARQSGKPIWAAPGPPWSTEFAGSLLEIERGAHVLWSKSLFLTAVFGEDSSAKSTPKKQLVLRTPEENSLLEAATARPEHLDELCELAGLSPTSAATALLTLALEHVLVEGPPGYYRKGVTK